MSSPVSDLFERVFRPVRDPKLAERIAFLQTLSLLKDLTATQAGKLLTECVERGYGPGDTIFSEGDQGNALFIIVSGFVAITKKNESGESTTLVNLGPGTHFGELALLDALPRSASAIAIDQTTVLILYKANFDALVSRRTDIGLPIMTAVAENLARQVRRLNEQVYRMKTDKPAG
ncbi:MAG: cyclic nucleotide-binding domain-containing protein [Deltaproteobacteria bacterium]|nr:cyclic nucleotide-binding domain-containing protein [Deltaproteobacteria bacterium]